MTELREHAFPFTGTDEGVNGLPQNDEPSAPGRSRTAVIAAALVGVLVLATAAYFVFLRGGDSSTATGGGTPIVHKSAPKVSTPVVKPKAKPAVKPFVAPVGRDPFKPLVVPPVLSASGVTGVTGTTATTPLTGTTGTGTTTTTGTTGTGTNTATSPISVRVVDVAAGNTSARLLVGSKSYAVAVGDVFGTYFKVLRLTDGKCGTFQYGDTSFDLCEGQTTRLQ